MGLILAYEDAKRNMTLRKVICRLFSPNWLRAPEKNQQRENDHRVCLVEVQGSQPQEKMTKAAQAVFQLHANLLTEEACQP